MSVVCTGRLLGARAPPPPPPPPPAADALLPGRRSLLSPTDLAAVACTHRAWRKAVDGEEPLWRALCEAEFCLAAPVGPDRQAHLIWPVWAPGHTRVACLEEGGGMDGAALPRGGGLPEVREAWDGSGALSLFSSVTDRPWA